MGQVEPLPRRDDSVDSSALASEEAICLFAFAESVDALEQPPPDATFEHRFMLHRVGSVAALVGIVPITDYCGADAERHLADIAWLAPRVRRHAELVEWMTQWSSVFPAPFGTLYSSLDRLTAFMHAHEATIASFLRAVADKEEWELRAAAQFDDPDILDRLACNAWPDWRNLSKGARYMRLCRDRNALLDFGRAKATALVRDLIAELQPLMTDIRQQGSSRPPDSSGSEPVARYALLVAKTDVAAMKERVREMAFRASRQHVAIALSGPWPPFSFRPDLKSPD
ncbi:MAG: GvpL/GvpF family gas vesicle protein [Roseiarcus sp.]